MARQTPKTAAAKHAYNRSYLARDLRNAAEYVSAAQSEVSSMTATWVAIHQTTTVEEETEARAIYAELNALHNRIANLAAKLAE